jgi:uncharacterized protein (TIGR02678 family)
VSAEILADVLDQQRVDERQRAVRALLRHPLLTPRGPDAAAFALVRRHAGWLADWFGRETGWSLHADAGVVRLRKTPGSSRDATRGALAKGKVHFSRRRYVLACLALAVLERAESQVTLGHLVERLLGLAGDVALETAGIVFALESREERADLVAVARLLLEIGVLHKVAGDEQAFVNRSGDALYDLDRRVLATLLVARRGPSLVHADTFEARLDAIVADAQSESEDGRNRALRHALARRLLDDPVLYYADLSEAERGYLAVQRGPLLRRLTDATSFVAEVRAEGIALIDPSGEATDLGMPEEGTDGHATLLLADYLAACVEREVEAVELEAHVRELVGRHQRHWRKNAREPGAERELTRVALDRLESLGLIRRASTAVVALPALARFAYQEPVLAERRSS